MSTEDGFDDMFGDLDIFKSMLKSQNSLKNILDKIRNGEMKGSWEITQIDEPDIKGYTIRGHIGTDGPLHPLEPLEPFNPQKRRPVPERLFSMPKMDLNQMREPLVDTFDNENELNVYVELPGVEKDDIKLEFSKDNVELSAKNFKKMIELPNAHVNAAEACTEYKNGLLHIKIPKLKQLREQDKKDLKAV